MLTYSWPGNIRELRNTIERLLMLSQGRAMHTTDLPDALQQKTAGPAAKEKPIQTLEEVEREHIRQALARGASLEQAARALGITTVTLWRKRKEYGLP
jgi:NtrC-family two-component system response regulator AlgB